MTFKRDEFSLSEVARELGVTRQRVHQKVRACENPYIKLRPDGGRPKTIPWVDIETYEKITAKIIQQYICPFCQTINRLTRINYIRRACKHCGKVVYLKKETP